MEKDLHYITLKGQGSSRIIRSRVLQSPLSGVSDCVFRALVRQWAPDALLFTEMVNAKGLELGHGLCKVELLEEEEGPVGVQLFDYRPSAMVEAARKAEELGAFLVDINMGCPVKKVARKGGGSGLLKDPDLAARIVKEVSDAISIPVTVKTRLGWNHYLYDPIGFSIRMQEAGAKLLTMHGRTRAQGFSGKADWGAIAEVKQVLDIPVIANGDINTPEDAKECLALTGADGVMIGRASLGSPWLVGQIDAFLKGRPCIQTPQKQERLSLLRQHLLGLLRIKGEHGLLVARKHINWTCVDFPGANNLRRALISTKTSIEALNLLDKHLELHENSSFKRSRA
ncbi:tRNA dihydrouridine synthase DusB [Prochlorococcus sp. MIT 1341]|uniref:tRNA dihydrouridine synthase DusB n=1 Tax=Prochlorococcus sp. MIT 1341 TaxID=3096221 RepID=UPI002A754500|nr:tRNA dihydrouridine synthase DusB [Prochlorococcus sp. MIT 1341]